MTADRKPPAGLVNAERPADDRPPAEPESAPKIALPDGWFYGSVGGRIQRLREEIAALKVVYAEAARENEALRAEVRRLKGEA